MNLFRTLKTQNSVNKSIKTEGLHVRFEGELKLVHLEMLNRFLKPRSSIKIAHLMDATKPFGRILFSWCKYPLSVDSVQLLFGMAEFTVDLTCGCELGFMIMFGRRKNTWVSVSMNSASRVISKVCIWEGVFYNLAKHRQYSFIALQRKQKITFFLHSRVLWVLCNQ